MAGLAIVEHPMMEEPTAEDHMVDALEDIRALAAGAVAFVESGDGQPVPAPLRHAMQDILRAAQAGLTVVRARCEP